jgi:hypothetical protein
MSRVPYLQEQWFAARFQRAEAEKHMGKILETDLTKTEGDPTARAVPLLSRERCKLKFTMPTRLGNATVGLETQTFAGTSLAAAITTLLLVAAGCLVMVVAAMISAPTWATISGLLVPAGIFMIIQSRVGRSEGQLPAPGSTPPDAAVPTPSPQSQSPAKPSSPFG